MPDATPGFGARRRLRIAAGDVSLCRERPGGTSILNVLAARVEGFLPGENGQCGVRLRLSGDGAALIARISERSRDGLGLKTGDAVFAQVKGVALVDLRRPIPDEAYSPMG